MAKSLMIQGTASDAGKSLVVAGLCRLFAQAGYRTAPFKAQNMALNSYVTATGQEMGRAQVFQAEAARCLPDVRMNPVLLKPTSDHKSQVIFNGQVLRDMDAAEYHEFKPSLKNKIKEVYEELAQENDLMVIEGAGSPAEINLNSRDIVNMGMAELADAPVLLVADIDKGGVFAAIYGTIALLKPEERARIKGIIINKFRGTKTLLDPGLKMIEELTQVPVVGVIPYANVRIEEEDSVALNQVNRHYNRACDLDVAVVVLSKISNFTDFRSLSLEPDVSLRYIFPGDAWGTPDILILPGTKNTIDACLKLQQQGFDREILRIYGAGKTLVGICGGFQILGTALVDPKKLESAHGSVKGLGLLQVTTEFSRSKTMTQVEAQVDGLAVTGYEIHMGKTQNNQEKPFAVINLANGVAVQRLDGAESRDGRIIGTYLHGIFDNSQWRRKFLNKVRLTKGLPAITDILPPYKEYKDAAYDELATLLAENLDMAKIYQIINKGGNP